MHTSQGVDAGDGVSMRAHGDTKPRRACRHTSPRTRFVLAPPARAPPVATAAAAAALPPICVALGVPTRARSAETRASKLPLFRILLPSLLETIETGAVTPSEQLRFEVHVGHDEDDPWWSSARNRAKAAALAARMTRGHAVCVQLASLTTHHSTTHYSLLTTHYSLLTTHCSLLTTYPLPLTGERAVLITLGVARRAVPCVVCSAQRLLWPRL